MKLPILHKFRKEDYSDAPEWWTKAIMILNVFLDSVYNLFNGNITFGDNIASQIETYKIRTTDFPYTISIKMKRTPQVCLVGQVANNESGSHESLTGLGQCDWELVGTDIKIHSIPGLTAGVQYRITFFIV